jgi:hypothetical protein
MRKPLTPDDDDRPSRPKRLSKPPNRIRIGAGTIRKNSDRIVRSRSLALTGLTLIGKRLGSGS